MRLVSDLRAFLGQVSDTLARRKARAQWNAYVAGRGVPPIGSIEAAIYFPDLPVNVYQIRQWYEPMRKLDAEHQLVVITRHVETANLLRQESPLRVLFLPTLSEIERWMVTQQVAVVFYVNQNTRNFQMLRFEKPTHVFVSHGESDKVYMASNQLKAYDRVMIAGNAARERIKSRLLDFDDASRLVEIGRPQVDVEYEGPELIHDSRTAVLYAPTWEGDRPSMSYSSIKSHGLTMVSQILNDRRYRLIYRPHPRTGAFDPTYRESHNAIVRAITAANVSDSQAKHLVDTETAFGWHLKGTDFCITDISAVAFDWLATGKPMILTEPRSPEADIDQGGIADLLPTLKTEEALAVTTKIADLMSETTGDKYKTITEHYFGSTVDGASMQRFLEGSRRIISERQQRWVEPSSDVH